MMFLYGVGNESKGKAETLFFPTFEVGSCLLEIPVGDYILLQICNCLLIQFSPTTSQSGCMVKVLALPSGDSRFESGHENLRKPSGEYAALVRLCMIDGTKTGKRL